MWEIISNWESLFSLILGTVGVISLGYYCYSKLYSKLALIYAEMIPNGGSSLRDGLNRIETLLKTSLNINEKPFMIFSPEGELTYASDDFCSLVGKSESQLLGFGWINTIDELDVLNVTSHWLMARENEIEFSHSYNLIKQDGTKTKITDKRIPMFTSDKLIGYFGWIKINQ